MIKIISVAGARPQFIKTEVISRAISVHNVYRPKQKIRHIIIHTGQHYDDNMSNIFFRQLKIPRPKYNLKVGSAPQGEQTAKMLIKIEKILLSENPNIVLTYGDTNSALAAALAAVKLNIPVAHVEAGLRSYNRRMPEENNRVIIDHLSDFCFCPNRAAIKNLEIEGIRRHVYITGDVMNDAVQYYIKHAENRSDVLRRLNLKRKKYYLATVHRPYNTDSKSNLHNIIQALSRLELPVIFPIHPRTRKLIFRHASLLMGKITVINSVSYFDMLVLEKQARAVLTDSGGMQKEAYILGTPCITMRSETEWTQTVTEGWNTVTGANRDRIMEAVHKPHPSGTRKRIFGNGAAGNRIIQILLRYL